MGKIIFTFLFCISLFASAKESESIWIINFHRDTDKNIQIYFNNESVGENQEGLKKLSQILKQKTENIKDYLIILLWPKLDNAQIEKIHMNCRNLLRDYDFVSIKESQVNKKYDFVPLYADYDPQNKNFYLYSIDHKFNSDMADEKKILEYYGKEHNFIIIKFFETRSWPWYISEPFNEQLKSYSKEFLQNLIPVYYK